MATPSKVEKPEQPALAKHDASILDLVFVMDCTGSMGSYIESATENIRSIVEEIVASEKSDIHLALVEYRDHPPQETTFVTRVHDFTSKVKQMKAWLEGCSAEGGGDTPEAVADALHDVLKLSWREEATKICILISDAPPHGLDPNNGDAFPEGDPTGVDPIKVVRDMAEKHIMLYVIGVEPPIIPYRDFFMTLAYITGGQYVPMINAKLLAQVIIGGVREEISLERLMQDAQEDISKEIQKAEDEGADEEEITKRVNSIFVTKNTRVKRMDNLGGEVSSVAKSTYSRCVNMKDLRSKYVIDTSVPQERFGRGAPKAVRRFDTADTYAASDLSAPPAAPALDMSYELKENEAVSISQTERIVQRMRKKK